MGLIDFKYSFLGMSALVPLIVAVVVVALSVTVSLLVPQSPNSE